MSVQNGNIQLIKYTKMGTTITLIMFIMLQSECHRVSLTACVEVRQGISYRLSQNIVIFHGLNLVLSPLKILHSSG